MSKQLVFKCDYVDGCKGAVCVEVEWRVNDPLVTPWVTRKHFCGFHQAPGVAAILADDLFASAEIISI